MKKTNFKTVMTVLAIGFASISVSFLTSCSKSNKSSSTSTTMTLYDSLGGTTMVKDPTSTSGAMIETGRLGLRSVVDSTIFVIAGDTSLNKKFFSVLLGEVGSKNYSGFEELSKNLTDFFCVATGAKDYTYSGLSMTNAHNPATNPRMGTKAAAADFDKFVGDLAAGAAQNKVPSDLVLNHIAPLVYTLEGQVVQK